MVWLNLVGLVIEGALVVITSIAAYVLTYRIYKK
jgi:hypothetical protein